MTTPVYLDCNATTPLEPRVLSTVADLLETCFGNPSSHTHEFGTQARAVVERSRETIGSSVDVAPSGVIFTSGATEANNLAIFGINNSRETPRELRIVTTAVEHKSVLEPVRKLESAGCHTSIVKPEPNGAVSALKVVEAVLGGAKFLSVMHVNNETGVVFPIREIADSIGDSEVVFHVDAAQSFGKLIDELKHPRIDLISVSAHKMYGPKGIGALIVRPSSRTRKLAPILHGGGQERGLRAGTLPAPFIAGFAKAAELAVSENALRAALSEQLGEKLRGILSEFGFIDNCKGAPRVPHVINGRIPGIDADALMLATKNVIAISNGSACTSSSRTPSHVLTAMGLNEQEIDETFRMSWGHLTPDLDSALLRSSIQSLL